MPIAANTPLPSYVSGFLPGEETVMGQSIQVDASRWQKALADRGLPSLEGILASPGLRHVSRRVVFELGARDITPENAFQLLYYSLAWGLGKRARKFNKRLDGLAEDQENTAKLLTEAWTAVRSGEPAEVVYSTLTTSRGKARIPQFGPAFSTKFLYFAQGPDIPPRYVILDKVVAGSLHEAWPGAPKAGWYPDAYGRYCSFISRWADLATEEINGARKVRADEIEFTLFTRK
ncbi:hypothetical protein H9639_15245 [Arthrobacter sp. Sa2CUA1]|uniref:Uncharacterized protein n=1 Tax=Arthrobacter gallicola TaxID=2762225 RepID=A0ABR8UVT0_9MICC|nr:hypothetical protein [Arthrobacter gallicola]MBD7996653.1 hypothetical protein [Arthrobacter gallicola]